MLELYTPKERVVCMKITDYKTYIIGAGFRNLIFVKVFTDEGIYGVGEATIEWKTNATAGALEDIRPYVIGADPRRIEYIFSECFRQTYWHTDPCTLSAVAAVEMACVDITGKAYNVPAYQLFGGKLHDKLRIYKNGFSRAKDAKTFAADAKTAVDNGASALKWDCFGSSWITITHEALDRVIEYVSLVREAVGPKVDVIIEAHGRFNNNTALLIARELEPFKLKFIEEPVFADNVQDTIDFHKTSPVPTAAGERLFGKRVFRELISCRGTDYVQPDMVHCGGMNELRKIGIMAEAHNIQFAPHNPNGPIANAATMHICATLPNFEFLETIDGGPMRTEITNENRIIEDGYIVVPDAPGLGIDFYPEACAKYPPVSMAQGMFSGSF